MPFISNGRGNKTRTHISGFGDRYSTFELYPYGRRDRIWTCNPLVPNQVRYQVALLSDNGCQSWVRTNKCRSQSPMCYHFTIWQFGVGNGTWTRNSLLGRQRLYQLSYSHKWCLNLDSNGEPIAYKAIALAVVLFRQILEPVRRCNRKSPGM